MEGSASLRIEFAGAIHAVPEDGEGLVFGRGAPLDIDHNPFLHRNLGRFVTRDGVWWLEHFGGQIPLNVCSDGATSLLTTGGRVALFAPVTIIRFTAGLANYELVAHLDGTAEHNGGPADRGWDSTLTMSPDEIPLTSEQMLVLLVLAETRLRTGRTGTPLPSNAAAAHELGWSLNKYNRKLDWLCNKLTRNGITGLHSSTGRANERRHRLVEFMIASGRVTAADLALLDAHRALAATGTTADRPPGDS
ncbi:MAG TPA: hypothetical protein PLV93_08770 [Microthrixaceae bacterium]|nr:hypothetical protein [Microthrixaceae bacterium]